MTTDDIIRMAREAKLVIDGNNSGDDDLLAFANLVAARAAALEREACVKHKGNTAMSNTPLLSEQGAKHD